MDLKIGCLVATRHKSELYLTPDDSLVAEEMLNWPEWKSHDLGVVLECSGAYILVMTSVGDVGWCDLDEVKVVNDNFCQEKFI